MLDTLPSPRIPASPGRLPDPQVLDALHPGSGDPIRAAQALISEARKAVADLESGRPGGDAWGAAMSADADALVASGALPKTTRVETLAKGDLHRWSVASAMARTLIKRVSTTVQAVLDDADLLAAAESRLAEVQGSLDQESAVAYSLARKGSAWRADAWRAFNTAKSLAEESTVLRGLVAWLGGRDGAYDARGWGAGMSPETAGHMLGCEDLLEGTRRLVIPKGVKWPAGHVLEMVSAASSTALLSGEPFSVPGAGE